MNKLKVLVIQDSSFEYLSDEIQKMLTIFVHADLFDPSLVEVKCSGNVFDRDGVLASLLIASQCSHLPRNLKYMECVNNKLYEWI